MVTSAKAERGRGTGTPLSPKLGPAQPFNGSDLGSLQDGRCNPPSFTFLLIKILLVLILGFRVYRLVWYITVTRYV